MLDEPASCRLPEVAGRTLGKVRERVPSILASSILGVHVFGETGTGKEVVANLFRAAVQPKPFISVNCGALPKSLLEAALFGVVKGAFTGATTDRRGFFEEASGGWLFLDEVACLTPESQMALLRVLETREIIRVGSSLPVKVDVRILSATNENLRELVQQGLFRRDLWQRLAETTIELPPLRDRSEEINEILDHLLKNLTNGPYRLSKGARRKLRSQAWQDGNIRQLRNCLRAMTERQVHGLLSCKAIPGEYLAKRDDFNPQNSQTKKLVCVPLPEDPVQGFARMSAEMFVAAVRAMDGQSRDLSVRTIARRFGLSKSTVSRKLREASVLGIQIPKQATRLTPNRKVRFKPSP